MITRAEQIAHLSIPENLKLFVDNCGSEPEGYFADYYEEYEAKDGRPGDALYQRVCADLGLVPLKGGRFDEQRGTRRQKSVVWAAIQLGVPLLSGDGVERILRKLYDLAYKDALEDAKRVQQ